MKRAAYLVALAALATAVPPAAAAEPAEVSARRLAGQMLTVQMSGTRPSASLLRRVERGEVGGVIVMGANVSPALPRSLRLLQAAARRGGHPRLLVATDQEGGRVRRFRALGPFASAEQMGRTLGAVAVARAGERTGRGLRERGVNVDLAPVADVPRGVRPFIALEDRAFSRRPRRVAALARAFADGLARAGVAATAKHFPGLGGARANTDGARAVVGTTAADLAPFRALVDGGIPLVMMSNAIHPDLDPRRPAGLSPRAVGFLRREVGFDGVVITDTLSAVALRGHGDPFVRGARAGVDVLLHIGSERAGADAHRRLLAAVRAGRLSRTRLETAYARVLRLKATLR